MKADNSTFGRFSAGETDIIIDDVAAIAKQAGDAIMEIYTKTPLDEWKAIADFKADGSPLTKADTTANKIICDALAAAYPKIPIMSEENKMLPYDERKGWDYFWCVDPLDGTKEFIKRNGQFTVNIGLVKGTSPLAGVVYVPAAEDGRVSAAPLFWFFSRVRVVVVVVVFRARARARSRAGRSCTRASRAWARPCARSTTPSATTPTSPSSARPSTRRTRVSRSSRPRPTTRPRPGQDKGDSTSLQRGCSRSDSQEDRSTRSRERIHLSRTSREMIARPKMSRIEQNTIEI